MNVLCAFTVNNSPRYRYYNALSAERGSNRKLDIARGSQLVKRR
jgi:hypothetical protein